MISLIGNDSPLEIMNFPDGESFVKFDYNNKPINILWRYENDAELMVLAQMYDVMNRIDNTRRMTKNLFIPYFPHARQDRSATDNQPFSLRVATRLLIDVIKNTNTLVCTLDIHSLVMNDLIVSLAKENTWQNVSSFHYAEHLKSNGYDAIIAPDKGAKGRALNWQAELLKGETTLKTRGSFTNDDAIIRCEKVRDPETGKLSEPKVLEEYVGNLVSSKKALLVDDIGTGFGTHVQLGNVLKKINPDMQLDIFVAHSSFTRGKDIVLDVFNKVYTTDSLPKGMLQVDDRIVRFDCTEFLPMV